MDRLTLVLTKIGENIPCHEKTCLQCFRPVGHKQECTASEDGLEA